MTPNISFVFDGRRRESILSIKGMRDNAILVGGPSKRFGVPGWRLGYVAGPSEIIKALTKLQGHISSRASQPAQHTIRDTNHMNETDYCNLFAEAV